MDLFTRSTPWRVSRGVAALAVCLSLAGAASTAAAQTHATASGCNGSAKFRAAPCVATEDTRGNVSFTLLGRGLTPLVTYHLTTTLPCRNNVDGRAVRSDLNGLFNFSAEAGPRCVRGTFEIQLQRRTGRAPLVIYSTTLTIRAP